MAYTPTTWVTGDSVTATKLNKLEQGVANADAIRGIMLLPSSFSSSSHTLGLIGYFRQINNRWTLIGNGQDVYWENNNPCAYSLLSPPADTGMKVFWIVYAPSLDEIDLTFSGDINSTPITVYDTDNNGYNGYELTGVGCVEAVAT